MKGRAFLILLAVTSAAAQRLPDNANQAVRVHLASPDGSCDTSARITLAGEAGPSFEGSESSQCDVEFVNVPEGSYRVELSSREFTSADVSSNIFVSSAGPANFDIRLRRTSTSEYTGISSSAFISAADLAVPARARKQFDKANELLRRQELQAALQKLDKAIHIYPQYAAAYNNLAVIYSKLGDRAREDEALRKALSIKPDFALAYVNVGRMDLKANDVSGADAALTKAAQSDPADAVTLILLSYSKFLEKQFDAAIATSRKAHELQQPHAFAHRVAARAFEEEKKGGNAIAELEMFLKEEPDGPRSDAARREIEVVKTALPN